MKKEFENAVFVAANCNFGNHKEFIKEIKESETFKKVGNLQEIKFQSNIDLPEDFPMPICGLYVDEISILYFVHEKRISIETRNYEEKKETLKNILTAISNMKIADISALGFNYDVVYNTGNKKLNIFNASIHNEFPNWKENIGFKVTIPLDLQELELGCKSVYEIKKHSGGTDKNGQFEDYKYNIAANYHFNINGDKAKVNDRLKELNAIICKIDNLYSDFEKTCEKVIKL